VIRKSFDAWAPYLIGGLIGIAVMAGLWYWRRHQVVPRDANGMLPGIRVGDKVLDPERSILPVVDPRTPVQVDRAAHLQITENAQKVQALRQLQGKGSPAQALGLLRTPAPAAVPTNDIAAPTQPAPWSTFARETGPDIPLGVGPSGAPHLPDLEEYPHRLFAGTTGGGKSRYGLRPEVAGALGRGWSVVVIGDRAPVDFKVFEAHPNFHPLTLDEPAQALPILAAINIEIKRRWEILYARGASTWSRLDKAEPRVLIVFDEFAATIDDLEGRERSEFIRQVTNISRLARKAGVHLAIGVQNPTADNIRPSIRRNMLPVAFRVTDQVASRVILEAPGAEALVPPQYLARMLNIWQGVGFDPTDEQIGAYLDSRRVPAYDPPAFLTSLPAPAGLPDPDDPRLPAARADAEIERLAELIRSAWERGDSKRAMARAAGREYAGWFAGQIDKAIEYLVAHNPVDSATTSKNGGGSSLNVAHAQ
jgi:hypothetical protein